MSKITPLNRFMSGEIRLTQRKCVVILIVIFMLFICALDNQKSSCNQLIPESLRNVENLPTIYAVTPTYKRPEQKAELTRISHLFRLVPNLFWIIVEDADETSVLVRNLINRAGISDRAVQIHAKTPDDLKLNQNDPHWSKPRGVEQRNTALKWIRQRIENDEKHSLVFFMDDDNSYSVELFEEMSRIERSKVGIWGVGLVGGLYVEKPIAENGKVIGFNSMWAPERPFPIDMAGFAISCDLLKKNPDAAFHQNVKIGYEESEILKQVTTREELQPIAPNQILVWHTRTEKGSYMYDDQFAKEGKRASDFGMAI